MGMERRDYYRPVAPDGRSSIAMADAELSQQDECHEPHNPSLDEPWDPRAADALVQLYESGDARLALQSSLDDGLRERLSHLNPRSSSMADTGVKPLGEADRDWLEAKLARVT